MYFTLPDSGKPGATTKITCGDVAGDLSAIYDTAGGHPAIGALVTCEAYDVRFTFGTATPTAGAAGTGHVLAAGNSLVINNGNQIRTFQYINYTQQSDAILQVTPFFEIGRP